MRSPQTLTRRLVPALAVTVVATLVFGAVLVTADVADGTEPLLPESFAVAAPKQGDAWRYNVTLAGDWTFGLDDEMEVGKAFPFGTFQWAGEGKVRGGDGFVHDANRFQAESLVYYPLWLEELDADASSQASLPTGQGDEDVEFGPNESPYWTTRSDGSWVGAGSRTITARGERSAENESSTNFGIPFTPGAMAEYYDMVAEWGYAEYPVDEVPCLVFNPLQGQNITLSGEIQLFDACSLGGQFLTVPDGLGFVARAVETVGGVQAIRFDGALNGTAIQAWFTPAVPYPVRIAMQLPNERADELEAGDIDLPGARSAVLEMVGFVAGDADLASVDQPSDPAPALAFAAPMTLTDANLRAGPDETGIVHPFPLSEAIQAGWDAPTWADLRTYIGSNPDAYVAAASFMEGDNVYYGPTTTTQTYSYAWMVVMANGQESFSFVAAKARNDRLLPTAANDALANMSQPDQPLYQFERDSWYPYGQFDVAPYPSQLPAELPTAASLMARWAAFDGSEVPANSYGFAIGCALDEETDDCDVELQYLVGHQRFTTNGPVPYFPFAIPTNPYGSEEFAIVERLVAFEGDGTASWMTIMDQREYRSSGAKPPGTQGGGPIPDVGTSSDPGYELRSTEVTGMPSASSAWLPQPKEAASVTFLGVIVGALYWIWPKLGVVGLFSRLHRGELLDHPARAKLVQIVESQPGIHFHDLAQKAELANGTAVHHLRKLSDSGHLSVRRSGRYTCYFPGGRVDPGAAAAAPLLKSEGAKQVLDAVRAKPGMSNLELAQATGLQPSTVNYHVQRLSQAGLLAALRDGRSVRLHPGTGFPAAGAAA